MVSGWRSVAVSAIWLWGRLLLVAFFFVFTHFYCFITYIFPTVFLNSCAEKKLANMNIKDHTINRAFHYIYKLYFPHFHIP